MFFGSVGKLQCLSACVGSVFLGSGFADRIFLCWSQLGSVSTEPLRETRMQERREGVASPWLPAAPLGCISAMVLDHSFSSWSQACFLFFSFTLD